MSVDLKSINWKRNLNTLTKVFMDMKILGLFGLMGFTLYGIAWDTVMKPNLEQLKSRDTAIEEQRKVLNEKKDLNSQYGEWEKQLKSLDSSMVSILPSDQPNLIALTVADELREIAKGANRNPALMPLEPPHDKREKVELVPVGNPTTIDLLKPEGEAAGQAAAPPAETPADGPAGRGPGGMEGGAPTSLPVERFDYDLKVTGTYPALVDVINELVLRKKVVQISKISITKPADPTEPDAAKVPDHPVQLDMTVSLSIFLYASDQPPTASAR